MNALYVPLYHIEAKICYHVSPITTHMVDSYELTEEYSDILTSPLDTRIPFTTFTEVYDGYYPGITFSYMKEVVNIAEMVNGWNVPHLSPISKHYLVMEPSANTQQVLMTNTSTEVVHLFGDKHTLLGTWQPLESRFMDIDDFLYPSITDSDTPILVTADTPILQITGYIYRKRDNSFYRNDETLVLPTGFYPNIASLVAQLNACITMRGERNGYIYHFVSGKEPMQIGIEASHRQPDPSYLSIVPIHINIGLCETISLQLRTNKREIFPNQVANVF